MKGKTRLFISLFLINFSYLRSLLLSLDAALIKGFGSFPARRDCCAANVITWWLHDPPGFKLEHSLGKQSTTLQTREG